MQKKNKIISLFLSVSMVVVLSKIFGFVKQIVMAYAFGASAETDTIMISYSLISNFEYIIAQTLATAVVPIYIRAMEDGREKGLKIISGVLKLFFVVMLVIVFILMMFSPIWSKILAPTYSQELLSQVAKYIFIFAPILLFYVFLGVFRAVLNANNDYIPGELIGLSSSVILIMSIFMFSEILDENAIVIGFWGAILFNTFFMGYKSRKFWKIERGNPLKEQYIIELIKMICPMLMSYSMIFVNQQIDKMIVSSMVEGTVTAMSYGSVLYQFIISIIASFCMIMFTRMSTNAAKERHEEVARELTNIVNILVAFLLPITILAICFSEDIVYIIYARGAFDEKATKAAALALAGYSIAFIPYMIKSMYSRLLYSYMCTKQVMFNSTISIVLNIVLSLVLFKPLGVFGVTFASSIAEGLCGILNFIAAKKKNEYIEVKSLIKNMLWWILGGCVCLLLALLCKNVWFENSIALIRFIGSCVVCCVVYFICVLPRLLKIKLKEIDIKRDYN